MSHFNHGPDGSNSPGLFRADLERLQAFFHCDGEGLPMRTLVCNRRGSPVPRVQSLVNQRAAICADVEGLCSAIG